MSTLKQSDREGSGAARRPRLSVRILAPHLIFLLIVVVTFIAAPGYRSTAQISSLLQLMALLGVVAIGQNFVILLAGIDLSVGAVMTLTNLVSAQIMLGTNQGLVMAIVVGVLIGIAVGVINGIGIAIFAIPDMVMTLATMTILLGVEYLVTGGVNKGQASPSLVIFMTGRFGGVFTGGFIFWLLLGLVAILVLRKTVWGAHLYAVGLSRRAAEASGISRKRVFITAYAASGLFAAVAGLMLTGYVGSSYYSLGDPYQLSSIAAVVIGGTSIFGGVGGYEGTFSGVGTIVVLLSFLQIVGLPEAGQQIAYGLVLLLMLMLFVRTNSRKALGT